MWPSKDRYFEGATTRGRVNALQGLDLAYGLCRVRNQSWENIERGKVAGEDASTTTDPKERSGVPCKAWLGSSAVNVVLP